MRGRAHLVSLVLFGSLSWGCPMHPPPPPPPPPPGIVQPQVDLAQPEKKPSAPTPGPVKVMLKLKSWSPHSGTWQPLVIGDPLSAGRTAGNQWTLMVNATVTVNQRAFLHVGHLFQPARGDIQSKIDLVQEIMPDVKHNENIVLKHPVNPRQARQEHGQVHLLVLAAPTELADAVLNERLQALQSHLAPTPTVASNTHRARPGRLTPNLGGDPEGWYVTDVHNEDPKGFTEMRFCFEHAPPRHQQSVTSRACRTLQAEATRSEVSAPRATP